MIRELTASPIHPHVMTIPSAVAVPTLKAAPVIASVVGKTGAIETPARNTVSHVTPGRVVRRARNVVTAMAAAAPIVTFTGETNANSGATAMRPTSNPSAKPSERMFIAFDSGMPCAMRWRASQFHTPTSHET